MFICSLLQQEIIEFYNAVAKGQAFRLNRFGNLTHASFD